MKAAGWFGKGAALPDAVTGQATRAPEKPYMIVLDASISTRRVSYGPKSAYGPPGRVVGRALAFSQSVTRQSMFLNAAPDRRARRCSRGGTRVLSHPRSSAAAMSTAAAMNASVFDDEDALFDYFSTGKYARGSRKSLLFKVSNQQNNRMKTDFHDFVEANAKCTSPLSSLRCVTKLSQREHRPLTVSVPVLQTARWRSLVCRKHSQRLTPQTVLA